MKRLLYGRSRVLLLFSFKERLPDDSRAASFMCNGQAWPAPFHADYPASALTYEISVNTKSAVVVVTAFFRPQTLIIFAFVFCFITRACCRCELFRRSLLIYGGASSSAPPSAPYAAASPPATRHLRCVARHASPDMPDFLPPAHRYCELLDFLLPLPLADTMAFHCRWYDLSISILSFLISY